MWIPSKSWHYWLYEAPPQDVNAIVIRHENEEKKYVIDKRNLRPGFNFKGIWWRIIGEDDDDRE